MCFAPSFENYLRVSWLCKSIHIIYAQIRVHFANLSHWIRRIKDPLRDPSAAYVCTYTFICSCDCSKLLCDYVSNLWQVPRDPMLRGWYFSITNYHTSIDKWAVRRWALQNTVVLCYWKEYVLSLLKKYLPNYHDNNLTARIIVRGKYIGTFNAI